MLVATLEDRLFCMNVNIHVAANGTLQLWDQAQTNWRAVPPYCLDFARMFAGGATVGEAIKKLEEQFSLDYDDPSDLLENVDALLHYGVLSPDKPAAVPLEAEMAPPAFVIGTPRSGTTLLVRLLNAHPNIYCSSESNVPEFILNNLRGRLVKKGSGDFRDADLRGLDATRYLGRCMNDYQSTIARREGKSRWIDKTLFIHAGLDLLHAMFDHQAKFIWIRRHGLDITSSVNAGYAQVPAQYQELDEFDQMKGALRFWVDQCAAYFSFIERWPNDVFSLRFEDLIADTNQKMSEIFDFLGESSDIDAVAAQRTGAPHVQNKGDTMKLGREIVKEQRKNRWQSWPKPVLRELSAIANPTLEKLGYEPVIVE